MGPTSQTLTAEHFPGQNFGYVFADDDRARS